MAKVLLLGMNKLRFMPYAQRYLALLTRRTSTEVHIAIWDRDGKPDISVPGEIQVHAFQDRIEDSWSLKKKIPHLVQYRKYIKNLIRRLKPDKLIVMHSTTGILIADELLGRYQGEYILDYRDVTYERYAVYSKILSSIARNASFTFVSSEGFMHFLPEKCEVLVAHNLAVASSGNGIASTCPSAPQIEPIRLAFWGRIRHVDINEAIIGALCSQPRFELHYYGLAQGEIRDMLLDATNRYENIFYHGEYNPIQTAEFAARTDLLHNLYDSKDPTIPYAMGNKYYDALVYEIPQLCTPDSYMGKRVSDLGIGLCCDPCSPSFADEIYEYWTDIDWPLFRANCRKELDRIKQEIAFGEERVIHWLSS